MTISAGWLWVASAILLLALLTIAMNVRLRHNQHAKHGDRPMLAREDFILSLHEGGVSFEVALAVHRELIAYCSKGISLYPDDSLSYFLEIDADELSFIYGRLLKQLRLPVPPVAESLRWATDTPREISHHIHKWGEQQSALTHSAHGYTM